MGNRRRGVITIMLALACAMLGVACSEAAVTGSNRSPSDEKSESGGLIDRRKSDDAKGTGEIPLDGSEQGGGSDVPVWVNAAALTCSWDPEHSSEDDVALRCLVKTDETSLPKPSKSEIHLSVLDKNGKVAADVRQVSSDASGLERVFIMSASKLLERSIALVMDNQILASVKSIRIVDIFPELQTTAGLQCLNESAVVECLSHLALGALASKGASKGALSQLRLFVSSLKYAGDLGGLAGAEAKCQTHADKAGLGGLWTALVGVRGVDTLAKVPMNVPIVSVRGQVVFPSRNSLWGNPGTLIILDEMGAVVQDVPPAAFTGFDRGGIVSERNCRNWTSSSATEKGTVGEVGDFDHDWISFTHEFSCAMPARLYCLEYGPTP